MLSIFCSYSSAKYYQTNNSTTKQKLALLLIINIFYYTLWVDSIKMEKIVNKGNYSDYEILPNIPLIISKEEAANAVFCFLG
nr:hypothetical protein [Candidatus Kapabacteria bacterium]